MPHLGIAKVLSGPTAMDRTSSIVLAGAEAKQYSSAILAVLQRFIPTLIEVNVDENRDQDDKGRIPNRWEVAFGNPPGTKAESTEAKTLSALFEAPHGLADNVGLAVLDLMESNGESARAPPRVPPPCLKPLP